MDEDGFFTIGDNCLDVYVAQGYYAVGGNAFNVAANWVLHGLRPRYLGAVGDDRAAALLLDGVREARLDPEDVRRLPGLTGVTFIRLQDGDRQLLHEEFGVGLDLTLSDEEIRAAAAGSWAHVQGTSPDALIVPRLVQAGARVSVDLSTYHDTSDLDGVAVAFASVDDPGAAHPLAERILEAGAQLAVVMCGAQGSFAFDRWSAHTRPAEDIVPVDTCGAGDSYIAGFTAAYAGGAAILESMAAATTAAAATCLHFGAWQQSLPPIPPWLQEQADGIEIRA